MDKTIIDKIKQSLALNKRLMEQGPQDDEITPAEANKPMQEKPLSMSDEDIKKRDAEYRRKGWIK